MGADSSRVAQGIMTGIGFLGAGVIFKEGLSIRGLTTAASIWVTAGIGILTGTGFYFPQFSGPSSHLGFSLYFSGLKKESLINPIAQYHVSFDRNNVMTEPR